MLTDCVQVLSPSLMLQQTVSQPVCHGIKHPSGAYNQIFIIVWQLLVCWFGFSQANVKVTLRLTVGQSVSKSWCRAPSGAHGQILITRWQLWPCFVGRPLWWEDRSVFCICCWPLQAQSFLGPSPLGLATIFYCLGFSALVVSLIYSTFGWSRRHLAQGFCFRCNGS
jgi:hypothetical protein